MSQVIKKRHIVIASVLKPVDDPRMFEKMGQTLADTGDCEVHIIGFPSDKPRTYPNVHFHPSARFGRLAFLRITMPFRAFRKILELDPATVIVTTHELLIAAALVKIIRKTAIIYDIRENYFRNILFLPSFPLLLRPFLALWVRAWEKLLLPLTDHIVVSERGYLKELPFAARATVIENKVKRSSVGPRTGSKGRNALNLLFSGTLAESTGVFTAIGLAAALHGADPAVTLTIIGYSARHDTLQRLREAMSGCPYIRLEGGDRLVPHDQIMAAIAAADFGIIAYPQNPSTRNTVPTKLYEYLGSQLPVLLVNHPPWVQLCAAYSAAVVFDLEAISPHFLLPAMRNTDFYTSPPGEEVFWEHEAKKLVELIGRM